MHFETLNEEKSTKAKMHKMDNIMRHGGLKYSSAGVAYNTI